MSLDDDKIASRRKFLQFLAASPLLAGPISPPGPRPRRRTCCPTRCCGAIAASTG